MNFEELKNNLQNLTNGEITYQKIADILNKLYITPADILRVKDTVKELLQLTGEYDENKINVYNSTILKLKNRLNKLYIDRIDGNIDDAFYNENREIWQNELEKTKIGLNAILKNNKYFIEDVSRVLELCKNASNKFLTANADEKRKLINILCSNLSFDGENLHIQLKSVFGELLKNAFSKKADPNRQCSNLDSILNLSKFFVNNIDNKELILICEQLKKCA